MSIVDDPSAVSDSENRPLPIVPDTGLQKLVHYIFTNRSSIAYWLIFVSLSYLMLTPIWSIRYLPLGDLPDHAGQIRAIMEFGHYQNDYTINWFTPYIAAYMLTMMFALFMSVAVAIKVVLSLCLLAFPVASALLIKQLNGDRFWVISAFPIGYSFSFFWGFYSCVVGSAVAVFFIAFMVWYAKRDLDFKGFLLATGFSLLLFFAHVIPWGFGALLAPLILFIYNDFKTSLKKLTAVFAIFPVVAYWMSISGGDHATTVPPGYHLDHLFNKIWQNVTGTISQFNERTRDHGHTQRIKELISFVGGRPALWDYIVVSGYMLIWPLFFSARLTFDYRRWLPVLLVFALFMIVPYWIFDTAYVYFRFAVFLIPATYFLFNRKLASQILRWDDWDNMIRVGAISFAILLAVMQLRGFSSLFESFKENDRDFAAVLSEMEMDKNMMIIPLAQESQLQYSPAFMHFGGWYQAEKRGSYVFSFSHDSNANGVPLRFKGEFWSWPNPWNPAEFNWVKHRGDRFDYFLVRANNHRDDLFAESNGSVVLLSHHGQWYLYGKKEYARGLTPAEVEPENQ